MFVLLRWGNINKLSDAIDGPSPLLHYEQTASTAISEQTKYTMPSPPQYLVLDLDEDPFAVSRLVRDVFQRFFS